MTIEAFVPLKTLSLTKHRLMPVLSEPARLALVVAMAEDVVTRLSQHPDIDVVHVICGEGWDARAFLQPPIRLWRESALPVSGLNASLDAVAQDSEAEGQLFIHGDLPFLSHEDLSLICSNAREGGAILSPDRYRVGTNALLRWRQQSFPLLFGENSFASHREAVRALGVDWSEIISEGLGADIDTADDITLLQEGAASAERVAMLGACTQSWRLAWGGLSGSE